ncbi:MAG: 50S ribosomal protein L10 [Lachnospirales bacterium]
MAKIEAKKVVIDEIKEKISKASSVVLVDYRGITVEQDTELRKKLREAGVEYKIYKNTMVKFAVDGTEYEGLKDYLAGPTALAFSYDDPTLSGRLLIDDVKKIDAISFKAGVLDGVLYDQDQMQAVAAIPSREVLLSKLLGSLQGPMGSFARVIQAVADNKEA